MEQFFQPSGPRSAAMHSSDKRSNRRNFGNVKFGGVTIPAAIPLIVITISSILCASVAHCWDVTGHEAIGMTAMSNISPPALTQLKRFLGGRDLFDVSGWAHKVNEKHPETTRLHFQMQPILDPETLDLSNCPDGQCLVQAVIHFYGRLIKDPKLVKLVYPAGLKFTDTDCFKFLINLIGDLHEPMHFGRISDESGKTITGNLQRIESTVPTTLYDYWDADVNQRISSERTRFWDSGWTRVSSLNPSIQQQEQERWNANSANRSAIFEKWSRDTLKLTYRIAYLNGAIQSGFTATNHDVTNTFNVIREQILLAGLRLSFVVNSILEQRDAVKFRPGSGIIINEDEPDSRRSRVRMHAAPENQWLRNLTMNLSILGVVLAVLLALSRYIQTSHTPQQTSKVMSKEVEVQKQS